MQLKRMCIDLFAVTVKVTWKSCMEVIKFKASLNIKSNKVINFIIKENYFSA